MKKSLIIAVNAALIIGMLVFVTMYSHLEAKHDYKLQREAFESAEVAIERMTENYLEGEQRICDVWARYIDEERMTLEEASVHAMVRKFS